MAHAKIAAGIIAIICSTAAFAQITPEEAAAKLKQREAARQAAATQPATITDADLTKLVAELTALRAENARLKAEITKLKNAQAATAGGPADEIKKAIKEHRVVNGMAIEQANEALSVKFVKMSASSDGEVYSAIANRKQDPIGSVKGIGSAKGMMTGGGITGTEYTLEVKDGVVTFWSSRPYSASPGTAISR